MAPIGYIDNEKSGLQGKNLFTLVAAIFSIGVASSSFAQEKATVTPSQGTNLNVSSFADSFDDVELVGLSSSIQGAIFDLPTEAIGPAVFNLDTSDPACLTGGEHCLSNDDILDIGYKKSFTKNSVGGLDISLSPKASMRFNDEGSSAVVGALVKIGEDLREEPDLKANTWYMFAGADAEAVTYSPNSVGRLTHGDLHLQDKIIVGDSQAGVGYKIGDADVSVGYFRREVKSFGREINSGGISYTEDAAALSFTWRR